jgi:flagellar assembly protein FliH
MAAPAKFLFDTDFSAPDRRERAASPAELAQKIAAAEARAYRDGFDAGQREAKAESDRRAALALEEIKIALQGIAAGFGGIEARMETEAVDVAVAVARKLCRELVAAEPLVEIEGLVRSRAAIAGSNGRTVASCWSARRSTRKSASLSGATSRPGNREVGIRS